MRLVFAGTPEPAAVTLRALLASDHEIAAVITRPDARVGRGRKLTNSPVAALADEHGVPVYKPTTLDQIADELSALRADLGVVVAYGALIRPAILAIPAGGWVNVHYSLLPRHRGAAPVAAAIRAGDEVTGVSVFQLDAGLDTGMLLGSCVEPLAGDDTTGGVLDRLAAAGAELLLDVLAEVTAGTCCPVEQDEAAASYAGKLHAADAQIDITAAATNIDRQIRALAPHPGAYLPTQWGPLVLGPVTVTDLVLAPGQLQVGKRHVLLGTGSTALQLGTVTAPGRKMMAAADWARGARPNPAETSQIGTPS